jgi:7,8-dihydropterin-6-yl-methyl-4-(beta-D-ribofuranosyl)aminobenzene 5'-phosphate synthase
MKTTISVISENTAVPGLGLYAEHGLSMVIEQNERVMLDTGQSKSLLSNMEIMNIDPDSIDRIVLSHGHYDHTGGLLALLSARDRGIPVHVHPDAFKRKAAITNVDSQPVAADIGIQYSYDLLIESGADIRFIKDVEGINSFITSLSDVPRPVGWISWDERLMCEDDDTFINDPFNDDTSLIVDTDSGLVVCVGCAHAGIIEIIERVADVRKIDSIFGIVGGTHLSSAPTDYVEKAIDIFKKYDVQLLAANHCTGQPVQEQLAEMLPGIFINASAGTVLQF